MKTKLSARAAVWVACILIAGAARLHAQPPIITNQPMTRAVWGGCNVAFSVGATGAGPLSYQWQFFCSSQDAMITSVAFTWTNAPAGLAFDPWGNLFIALFNNSTVVKIDTNGNLTTVAGNGKSGYSGDGGLAINAMLNAPLGGLAVDAFGNLFIADSGNNRIREVNSNGIITTIAGNGTNGYSGDGGPATNASLNLTSTFGLALDAAGNLFVSAGAYIRKVDTNGIITTFAGNGTNAFYGDGGQATNASLHNPQGLAVDASGNLFLADSVNSRVRKINTNGIITTVAGGGPANPGDGGPATNASLNTPNSVALDTDGNLFIGTESSSFNVKRVDTNGTILTVAGAPSYYAYSPDGGAATNVSVVVWSLALDASGNLFIADNVHYNVRKVLLHNVPLPANMLSRVAGNELSVSGTFSGDGGLAVNAGLNEPSDVAVDSLGNLFVDDYWNHRIRKITTNGIINTVAGNGQTYETDGVAATNSALLFPDALALDALGNLYIAETTNYRIRRVDTNGIINTFAGNGHQGYTGDGGAATNAEIGPVYGLAVDELGNLLMADYYNRIRKVDTNGIITTVAGPYGGGQYDGVAPGISGNFYFADYIRNYVYEVDSNGIISTVAGGGLGISPSYGDGGPATKAFLSEPGCLATDASGNLYIADLGHNRIRRVDTNGIITTFAGGGSGDVGLTASLAGLSLLYDNQLPGGGMSVDQYGNLFFADTEAMIICKALNTRGPTLALNQVTNVNMGTYQVVVTGAGGSVTSSVASLIVANSPLIYGCVPNADGSLTLQCVSPPNSTNVVLCANSLASPVVWQRIATNVATGDGSWQYNDPAAAGSPSRFYRSLTY